MRKIETFQCRGCEQICDETKIVYQSWDKNKRPSRCTIVGICPACHSAMKRFRTRSVHRWKEFLDSIFKGRDDL